MKAASEMLHSSQVDYVKGIQIDQVQSSPLVLR